LNSEGKRVFGKGGAQILTAIDKFGSISAAARELKMSYRFVWRYLRRMEDILGEPVILTHRGGTPSRRARGGGGAELTRTARTLLKDYRRIEARLRKNIP